jgi:hypothetical protein
VKRDIVYLRKADGTVLKTMDFGDGVACRQAEHI